MPFKLARANLIAVITITLTACGMGLSGIPGRNESVKTTTAQPNQQLPVDESRLERVPDANPDRNAYFGDLHVHTAYSFDAYTFGTTATPYDAYRYAQGEPIAHPAGYTLQLTKPLDFYAVTDHAMFLGVAREAADTSTAWTPVRKLQ